MHAHIATYALVMLRMACVVIAFASWGSARAHGGGLDANGCHTNRKTGEYHCHRGPSVSPRKKPLHGNAPVFDLAPSVKPKQQRAYRNCSEARAAGAAPVRRGDPGYGTHLDRDNDGVGCE